MANSVTCYAGQGNALPYQYNVTFIIKKTGVRLTKSFDSEYVARKFTNKLKHSKECQLVAYPLFTK